MAPPRKRGSPLPGAVALGLLAALALPCRAYGQCGANLTECYQCHETQRALPVLAGGEPWHGDHAFGDFCVQCHEGDPQAKDLVKAHAGLVSPMSDVQASCGKCHVPTEVAGAYRSRKLASRRIGALPSAARPSAPRGQGNLILSGLILLVGTVGSGYIVRNERRLRAMAVEPGSKL